MPKRSQKKKLLWSTLFFIYSACGGGGSFELVVVNTLQSGDIIRVDIAGDSRQLNIGDVTIFRSISPGTNIISIEGLGCAGTIRDTLNITADATLRLFVTRNINTGSCEAISNLTVPKSTNPVGL